MSLLGCGDKVLGIGGGEAKKTECFSTEEAAGELAELDHNHLKNTSVENIKQLVKAKRDSLRGRSVFILILIGLVSGFMTGLLSVGGGFIIVPLLTYFCHFTLKKASGTSLLVIALVSMIGIGSAFLNGTTFLMPFTLYFALIVTLGLLFGRFITSFLNYAHIQRLFACVLVIIALQMFVKLL